MTTKRTYLLVILGCLLWVDSVYGTTWKTLSVTCPICATTNKAQVVNSAYIRGYEDDLKPRGVRLTLSSLIRCPNCRFTATKSGYESPSGLDTNKVSAALEKVSKEKLFELIDCAIATETNWQGRPAMIAQLAMEAKWVADETGENDLIVSRINAAITAHEKNLAQPPLAIEDARTSLYLIGELHRELGETVKAIEYFDRALRQPGGANRSLIEKQRFIAANHEKPPIDIAKVASASESGARLGAVELLRDSKLIEASTFIEGVCLNGPPDLRERAMNLILQPKPRIQHAQLFLNGLGNEHFRIVQGSAQAVVELGLTNAAATIVQIYSNAPEFSEYKLYEALSRMATEREIPFLATSIEADKPPIFTVNRLRGLLNTRSTNAVPHILELLQSDDADEYWIDEEMARLANALGSALLDRLGTNSGPAAVLRAKAICLSRPIDDPEIQHLLKQENLEASLLLAKRGFVESKAVLLKRINELRSRDEHSIEVLYPLVEETDFNYLRRQLETATSSDEESVVRLRKYANDILVDPDSDPAAKRVAELDLERLVHDELWILYRWILPLAATRNPEAIGYIDRLLKSDRVQLRAGAATALGHIDSEEACSRLVKSLIKGSVWERQEAIKSLSRKRPELLAKHLGSIVMVVNEPTTVEFKIEWLKVVSGPSAEAAVPLARKWTSSFNGLLADFSDKWLDDHVDKD